MEEIIINKQECDDINYDFTIPMVVTNNLINKINGLGKLPIQKVIFIAHTKLMEEHKDGSNIDYLQTFSYCGIDFWCISNKEKKEPYDPNNHVLTWLAPEDY